MTETGLENLEGAAPMNPEDAARAVFATLTRQVSQGEIEDVMQMVPDDVRAMFP